MCGGEPGPSHRKGVCAWSERVWRRGLRIGRVFALGARVWWRTSRGLRIGRVLALTMSVCGARAGAFASEGCWRLERGCGGRVLRTPATQLRTLAASMFQTSALAGGASPGPSHWASARSTHDLHRPNAANPGDAGVPQRRVLTKPSRALVAPPKKTYMRAALRHRGLQVSPPSIAWSADVHETEGPGEAPHSCANTTRAHRRQSTKLRCRGSQHSATTPSLPAQTHFRCEGPGRTPHVHSRHQRTSDAKAPDSHHTFASCTNALPMRRPRTRLAPNLRYGHHRQ